MFDRLRSAITTLERCARELQVECLEGGDAAELVDVIGRGERVCGAMKALLAKRVAETGVWRDGGSRSAGHWLAEQTGTTIGAAQQVIDTARALDELPRPRPRSVRASSRPRRPPRSPPRRSRHRTPKATCWTRLAPPA
jgi:hypothetical protein